MKKAIILLMVLAFAVSGCKLTANSGQSSLSLEDAKVKAIDFINTNLMQPGNTVSLKEAIEEDGLYKIVINMSNGQEVTSYITKDGKKFFPQVMDIAEVEGQKQAEGGDTPPEPVAAANVPKAEKASVELFVMSHCPYGTQIEKGMLPVIETLGDKMDFELKFCDYAMHGKKEVDEQINQVCIQKNEPDKLVDYLNCFLKEGDGDSCLSEVKINKSKLVACYDDTDEEYKITSLFNDKSTWVNGNYPQFNVFKTEVAQYGVSGSPSLVINGQKVSSGRDSASLLKTICNGFENPPAECDTELTSVSPGPGFGFDSTGGAAAADCAS